MQSGRDVLPHSLLDAYESRSQLHTEFQKLRGESDTAGERMQGRKGLAFACGCPHILVRSTLA